MNGAFCWKNRSAQILSNSLKFLRKKHSQDDEFYEEDESENERQTEDEDEEDDGDDIKEVDNTVFEISTRLRQQALDQQVDIDLRLRRWRELTNIEVSPELPPRRSKSFSDTVQQVLAKKGMMQGLSMKPSTDDKKVYKKDNKTEANLCHDSKVKFKFQYLIKTERLKVTVIKASNLFRNTDTENDLTASIEASLMSGKIQRQVTPLCKGTRNPVFNSIMFFNGFTLEEMHQMCFRIKINGREGGKGPLTTLGEVTVSLDEFDILGETLLEECVDTRVGSRSDIETLKKRHA